MLCFKTLMLFKSNTISVPILKNLKSGFLIGNLYILLNNAMYYYFYHIIFSSFKKLFTSVVFNYDDKSS